MLETGCAADESIKNIGTKVCIIRKDAGSIMYMTFFPDVRVSLQNMREIEDALFTLSDNLPFRVLMDIRNRYIQFDTEARNYAAIAPITKLFIAEAVLLNNLPTRLLFNFFLKFDRPPFPLRGFSQLQPATDWLLSRH